MLNIIINMHAASGLCSHGVSNVGSVTAGPAGHNSSIVNHFMQENRFGILSDDACMFLINCIIIIIIIYIY